MKSLVDVLADVRFSPEDLVGELMREQADIQETFITLAVYYIAAMAQRQVYHHEVAHIVQWSKKAIKALDEIAHI
jgi:hypothetical protein